MSQRLKLLIGDILQRAMLSMLGSSSNSLDSMTSQRKIAILRLASFAQGSSATNHTRRMLQACIAVRCHLLVSYKDQNSTLCIV